MKNTRLNIIYQPNQDNATGIANTKQNDKTLINNLPGSVSGNGNGSIFVILNNFNVNHPGCGMPVQFYYYPQLQPPPPPPLRPPSAYGNKRAVLVGITYGNTGARRLKGSAKNAQCMKHFLVDKLGFPSDSICMLTDDSEDKNTIPTKRNMRMAMRWLVEGCQSGDSLVFYFCGHGARVKDLNKDELDGYDEAIGPVDYEHEGMILDDEINATIVRPLPHGVKLHALVDASFSGTILDLPFMCRMNRIGSFEWKDQRHRRAGYKGTRGGLAVCISACDDNGNAADKSALTYSFLQAMQDVPKLTYGLLLNAMRSTIYRVKAGKFELKGQDFARSTWQQQYAHEPQLSSSEKLDIYSKSILM